MQLTSGTTPTLVFLLVSDQDFLTGVPDVTPTVLLSKNGDGFVNSQNQAVAVGEGWYKVILTEAETSSVGPLIVRAQADGTAEWRDIYYVVESIQDDNTGDNADPDPGEEDEDHPNLVVNGDFSSGLEKWRFHDERYATVGSTADGAFIHFKGNGDNMQFYQKEIQIDAGRYRLRFEASCRPNKALEVYLQQHRQPGQNLGVADTVYLNEDWIQYDEEFECPQAVQNARLRFWFVGQAEPGDVYKLRNISLTKA